MTITACLPTSGATFGPEAVASITKAFDRQYPSWGSAHATTPNVMLSRGSLPNDGGLDPASLQNKALWL